MELQSNRREFLQTIGIGISTVLLPALQRMTQAAEQKPPNIILLMADDLGYGDVGFNGNDIIHTPELDEMAKEGIRFTRFFAAAPVCSPTRATCLTGRHYYRYGIFSASVGYLPKEEITLARICKDKGYTTGHFGKWHLAPITKSGQTMPEYYEDRERKYAPPWERDYDESFVTECNVPTWNPIDSERFDEDSQLGFLHNGEDVTDNVEGAAARIVMDRALPFIQNAASSNQPFMTTIWFHEPHDPVVAGPEYKAMYSEYSDDEQHYYGCITAMDEQIGRLRKELRRLGIADNTMIWFCSDNGPAHLAESGAPDWWFRRSRGKTGELRGRKRSLFNGGIQVPGLLEWPGHAQPGRDVGLPCSTMDYFPTITEVLDYRMPDDRPIDGMSLVPLIRNRITERSKPIPFIYGSPGGESGGGAPNVALIDFPYKFFTSFSESGDESLLFNLAKDPGEHNNVIEDHPKIATEMKSWLREFIESCRASHAGKDYPTPFEPVNKFPKLIETQMSVGRHISEKMKRDEFRFHFTM